MEISENGRAYLLTDQLGGDPQWVNWRLEKRNGKDTKVPYMPNGVPASTTNAATWSTYAELDVTRDSTRGAGYVLPLDGSILAIDLDHIFESGYEVPPRAMEFIKKADSYVEKSPSGTGAHVFLRLSEQLALKAHKKNIGEHHPRESYECYTSGRYFTVTDIAIGDPKPIRTVTAEEAEELLGILGYPWKQSVTQNSVLTRPPLSDQEVLRRMFAASNGPKIRALYDGDTSAHKNDDSVADLALCAHLAFWTGKQPDQIERIWTASPLGAREKTQTREQYRRDTVAKAIEGCSSVYHEDSQDDHIRGQESSTSSAGQRSRVSSYRGKEDTHPVRTRAIVERFDTIQPQKVQWLWPDRVAVGKLTLIAGNPGLGKSLITVSMAAVVSSGSSWPVDNIAAQVGDVVILSAEDDPADTIRPRLDAAGADVRRVHIIKAVADEQAGDEEQTRFFSLRKDLPTLAEVVGSLEHCRLVIIDPISAYLGDVDSHNNADVRGLLAPLSELASRCKVAVVAVTHFNKDSAADAIYRTMGSLAFVAAARASYAVVKDSKDPRRRLMVPVKNNLGVDDTGYAYVVEPTENGASVVAWDKALVPVPSDLSSGDTKKLEEQADRDWATSVLEVILSKGPVPATKVYEEGKQAGLTAKQLMRIAKKLGVIQRKTSFDGGWVWELQKQASGQDEGYEALAESARETVLDGDMPVKEQGAQDVEGTGPGAESEG